MNNQHSQSTTNCCLGDALAALINEEMRLAGPLPSVAEIKDHLRSARAALRKPEDLFKPLFSSSRPEQLSISRIMNGRLDERSLTVLFATLTKLMQGRLVILSEEVIKIVGEVPPVPLGDVGISYHAARCLDAGDVSSALTRHRSGPTLGSVDAPTLPNSCWVSEFTSGKGHRYSLTTLAGKGTLIFTVDEANAFEARMHSNPGNN